MQPIKLSHDEVTECCDGVFENEQEMRTSLSRLCYCDLFVIGKIWIQALQAVLVGAKLCLIPVVHAKQSDKDKPLTPQRPPPMRYKDLSIYNSPHNEYKDYIADKEKCPEYKQKLLHGALLPHIKDCRKKAQETFQSTCDFAKNSCKQTCSSIEASKKDFKSYMRHPDNLHLRQGVVATGTVAGFLLGGGGGIPRRFFYTSVGALTTGALCFPKETDEYFREACYHTAKVAIAVYNSMCGKQLSLRERIPCKDDMPPEPKPRLPLCPPKK